MQGGTVVIDLKYSLVIEATEDPTFFGFYSPDLEGFTGIGHSVEDCLYKAKWGIEEHVALLKEQGLPVPKENPNPRIVIQSGRCQGRCQACCVVGARHVLLTFGMRGRLRLLCFSTTVSPRVNLAPLSHDTGGLSSFRPEAPTLLTFTFTQASRAADRVSRRSTVYSRRLLKWTPCP